MLIHADPGRRECSLLASSAETRNPPDAMLWLHWHLLATTTATNAWGNWTMQMPTKIVDHTPDESFHPINSFKYLILSNLCQALLKCLCTFSCFWAANPPPPFRSPPGPESCRATVPYIPKYEISLTTTCQLYSATYTSRMDLSDAILEHIAKLRYHNSKPATYVLDDSANKSARIVADQAAIHCIDDWLKVQ